MNELFERYKDRAEFFVVYIREAHPTDGWVLDFNTKQGIAVKDPTNEKERVEVASECCRTLGIKFPPLIDDTKNAVEKAYAGWPDRMYVVDVEGRIYYKGSPGPFGFKPDELQAALEKLFSSAAQ